ncbi:alpha-1,3-mannosyl-glycoprotein 4-beta-N-acetylglucosaminyltransferase A isoform 1 [Cricetulus griseus]|nr:alpha-1,3-mannosyl-glycoprotein 4-beta-N-acetylglucosaminyltransferase A isoform 1 [Cricetulus griseus]
MCMQGLQRPGEGIGSTKAAVTDDYNTIKLLKELTSKKSLQVPSIYYHLPHLLQNEGSLQPAVQIGNGRTGVSIVMGIPTVKREVKSYLIETLHSLIDNLYPEEKLDCVIVVFIGETDLDYVHSVIANLEKEFSKEISSGLLEIISPPESYYPDLTNLKETFGDSKERIRWRTKQNLDYCFLMMYAQEKGIYYIQLEDDIIVKQNYFNTIKNFALQLSSEEWMILEFSQLGFIASVSDFQGVACPLESCTVAAVVLLLGAYLSSSRILPFALCLQDWGSSPKHGTDGFLGGCSMQLLLCVYGAVVECFKQFSHQTWLVEEGVLFSSCCVSCLSPTPFKLSWHCDRQKANLRIRFRPSLFQHVGLHSSLSGKIQKLTDKDYMKPLVLKIHVNPPAEVSTSLKVYQGHTLEKTYMGEDFFWAITPTAGDYILFKFDKPVNVESYLFHSGNQEHPGDILLNTTVEVLPLKSDSLEISKETKDKRLEDGYFRIGKFEYGVAEGIVDPALNPISAFRLSVIQNSAVWAILNEIHIKKATN